MFSTKKLYSLLAIASFFPPFVTNDLLMHFLISFKPSKGTTLTINQSYCPHVGLKKGTQLPPFTPIKSRFGSEYIELRIDIDPTPCSSLFESSLLFINPLAVSHLRFKRITPMEQL